MSLKFYTNVICPFAHRAWITAVEKKVEMETIHVSLDNMPEWYVKINPRETVPAVVTADGTPVYESLIIARYFDDNFGEKRALYPGDAKTQYDIDYFIEQVGNTIGPLYELLMAKDGVDAKQKAVTESLQRLDTLLAARSQGPFFLGTTFSLADISIVPFLIRFKHTLWAYRGVDIFQTVPRLKQLYEAALLRNSVSSTVLPSERYIEAYKGYAEIARVDPPLKLYSNPGCPFCHSAAIAAKLKNANVELVEVSLSDTPEWYLKINPTGVVPTLEVRPGEYLYESSLIVDYLDRAFPEQGATLAAPTPLEAASARFFLDELNQGVELWFGLFSASVKGDEGAKALKKQWEEILTRVEALLVKQSKGPFFLGEKISTADVMALPKLVRFEAGVPVTGSTLTPRLTALLDAARKNEAVASTLLPNEEYLAQARKFAS